MSSLACFCKFVLCSNPPCGTLTFAENPNAQGAASLCGRPIMIPSHRAADVRTQNKASIEPSHTCHGASHSSQIFFHQGSLVFSAASGWASWLWRFSIEAWVQSSILPITWNWKLSWAPQPHSGLCHPDSLERSASFWVLLLLLIFLLCSKHPAVLFQQVSHLLTCHSPECFVWDSQCCSEHSKVCACLAWTLTNTLSKTWWTETLPQLDACQQLGLGHHESWDLATAMCHQESLSGALHLWTAKCEGHEDHLFHEKGHEMAENLSAPEWCDPHLPPVLLVWSVQEWSKFDEDMKFWELPMQTLNLICMIHRSEERGELGVIFWCLEWVTPKIVKSRFFNF